jgi:DNA-nicking Smr family endonuclease
MDFGEILDDWERIKRERKDSSPAPAPKPSSAKGEPERAKAEAAECAKSAKSAATKALEAWLATNGVRDKDAEQAAETTQNRAKAGDEQRRFAALKAEAILDLHGLKAEEAEAAIATFLDSASRLGLEKVLVIHGKGLHSEGAPVLKKAARRAIESHPAAGRFGQADKAEGGSGALWVQVRRRKG